MFLKSIEQAVERLHCNKLLIYPTETFFGLGCKASSEASISQVFKIKKRLLAMPLPVIIGNLQQLNDIVQLNPIIKEDVLLLAKHFWPGALSLILPARVNVSPLLTGGTNKIAVRQSAHPVATKIVNLLGEPIVSSSANVSGVAPVTKINNMDQDFVKSVGAVLDLTPEPSGGLASTIIEPIGNKKILVLREGQIKLSSLETHGFTLG